MSLNLSISPLVDQLNNVFDVGYCAHPTLFDIDNDNDLDLIVGEAIGNLNYICLLYTSPSPRDMRRSRMPSSA